ncbi:5756_t:CDS:2 [Paraglomus occultum]|uniref:5756_t:CDS:1 n=1 Tax=Paraglomus occultum TaxID=144539 RepID=A0A9N9A4L2_9GLOM|nr:5756_t:CDS:2 [Paraglomus occultum]
MVAIAAKEVALSVNETVFAALLEGSQRDPPGRDPAEVLMQGNSLWQELLAELLRAARSGAH